MSAISNRDDERCRELLHRFYNDEITPAQLRDESEKMIVKQVRMF